MENQEKTVHRSRPPLFEIQGYVIKQGEGWALIMERDTETQTMAVKQEIPGGAGATETVVYAYGPATALLCFKKGKFQPFPTETLFNFFVEVSAGVDQKSNKLKPKFWLTHADKLGPTPQEREEEKARKHETLKQAAPKFAEAVKILEPEQKSEPAKAPEAPKKEPQFKRPGVVKVPRSRFTTNA